MSLLYVAAAAGNRATAERTLPTHANLNVSTVDTSADTDDAVREALSNHDVDCVVAEHDDAGDEPHSDALRVLESVRDTDPAVPVVAFERAGANCVASDAVSLDVTEYVREVEEGDPLAAVAEVSESVAATFRAEQDVAMVNELARNVYERITDGFFALNRDWEFTYLNAAAEDILEVDSEEVVGENVWDAFAEATEYDFYAEYQRAMATQEPVTFREHYPPLDKTFEVRAFPSESGLSVHFRTVVEGEPEGRRDNLRELTTVLSADLSNAIREIRKDLADARTESDAADDALDDVAASVDRLEDKVNYAVRLAGEQPSTEWENSE